ncbi:unnamed protein product [Linum trigynum]|uniref:F-box domain-containing protein n=1 Tax=Linum trigynum TaxID=586398 RepID=A0AAV2F3B5_9ROSI
MKQPCKSGAYSISNLPVEVIELILNFLPIKDAARTSVLSRDWRHHWRSIPRLVFDGDFASLRSRKSWSRSNLRQLMTSIYQALQVHDGPITEFVLAIPRLTTYAKIDHILRYLSSKGVLKLELHFDDVELFELEIRSSLFSAVQLTSLKLDGCNLKPPSWFEGFSKLTVLELKMAAVLPEFFESFLPKCPLLEELKILNCLNTEEIELVAPCLKTFLFFGYIGSLHFKRTPLLSVVSILVDDEADENDMEVVFANLPALQQLYVSFEFLEELCIGGPVPRRLPTLLHCLEDLAVRSCAFIDYYHGSFGDSVLFCLIRSSPNLKTLTMQMESAGKLPALPRRNMPESQSLESAGKLPVVGCIQCLAEVKILGSYGSQFELDVVKFVSANAPQLHRILITSAYKQGLEKGLKFLERVRRCKRISKNAEIIQQI